MSKGKDSAMKINVITCDITQVEAGAVVVGLFEGDKKPEGDTAVLDKALNGAISKLINQGEIRGKPGEVTAIHSLGRIPAARVVIVGLSKRKDFTLDKVRGAVAEGCRSLQKKRVEDIAVSALGAGILGMTPESSAQAVTEGALLGTYNFRKHITKEEDVPGRIKKLSLVSVDKTGTTLLKRGVKQGRVLAEAAILARDMVNEPANYMTPSNMADVANKLAREYGLEISVLEKKDMQKLGMGALLGVAQGSCQLPKFIIVNYKGKTGKGVDLALVGKGITFDSGGISIKPSHKMDEMKGDMAGGAAVMAAISAISRLKLGLNVAAIVPAVENLPGGSAMKPGDVLTSIIGKTIEVISTDAEGRMILADALGYARKLKARHIVDVATLTGACEVALGKICTGVFTNNQEMADQIVAAGAETGELMWQMPMYDDYKEQNKSDIADIKNVGGKEAGATTAALFLAEFVDKMKWVHLDIAGTSMTDKEHRYLTKGATGVPVRTLVGLAEKIARRK
jgi:leucyl aminopeptidase